MQRNDRTHELVDFCKEVATLANSNSRQYYIGSGFSIDFSLGELTRDHEDVDLVIAASDVEWWKHEFTKRGYSISAYDYMHYFPGAFTVCHPSAKPHDSSDFIAEVWPMVFRDDGTLVPPHTADHPGREWWRGKNWHKLKRVVYEDVPMVIEGP